MYGPSGTQIRSVCHSPLVRSGSKVSIPFPEKKRFDEGMGLRPREALCECITRILDTRDVFKMTNASSNSFVTMVI